MTMRAYGAVALAAIAVVSCGDGDESRLRTDPGHSLVIETTYEAGPTGALYDEGALSEVIFTDVEGASRTERGPTDSPLTVRGLPPGTYRVEPGLRPCSGNCENRLDARTDTCEVVVTVPAVRVIRVRYVATEACQASAG